MTMIKGNEGGIPSLDNVDLTHAKDIICEKCGNKGFRQSMMLKKLSPLVSPNGQEAIIPVMVFACDSCGHINQEFQEADIKSA
jgi:uncharacterized Zn finger protein|tara:strand:+ start:198 stop:446 length:249 start_codon:yes stop_codon:yes gene_type:complete